MEYTNIVSDQEGLQSLIFFFSLFYNNKSVIIAVILGFSTLSVIENLFYQVGDCG